MGLLKFLFSIVLFCGPVLSSSGQAQPFSVTLQPPAGPVKAGSEVRVKVTTTNTSNHEIRFAKAFGEEEYDFDVEVRDAQGKTPPITESYRNVKQHPASRWGSYSTYALAPGKSLEEELVVTKLFTLTQPGKYTILVTRGQRPMWHTRGKGGLKSNSITVTVIPQS
jgi:uncharacterized protein (DUF58 family)